MQRAQEQLLSTEEIQFIKSASAAAAELPGPHGTENVVGADVPNSFLPALYSFTTFEKLEFLFISHPNNWQVLLNIIKYQWICLKISDCFKKAF